MVTAVAPSSTSRRRVPACFVGSYAAVDELRGVLFEMKGQFLFELCFHLRSSR